MIRKVKLTNSMANYQIRTMLDYWELLVQGYVLWNR